jgi:hypothetical protein
VQSEAAEPSIAEPKVTPVYSEQRLSSGSKGKDGKDGKDDSFKLQRERSRSKKSLEAKQNEGKEGKGVGKGVKESKDSSEGVVPAAFDEQEPCPESKRLSFSCCAQY